MGNNAETVPCGRKRKKPCTINYMRLKEVKESVKKREGERLIEMKRSGNRQGG